MTELLPKKVKSTTFKFSEEQPPADFTNRDWLAMPPKPQGPGEDARRDVFSTINARVREKMAEGYGRDRFSSGEDYQPPMSPGESFWDTLNSIPSAAAGLAEGTAGALGDVADSRYALAHYLNRKLSGGGLENDTAKGWIDTMEQYDPVSQIPNSEEVGAAADPIYEALGVKDAARYQPQSPWGQGLYTAGQFVDPFAAGGKAAKVIKGAL